MLLLNDQDSDTDSQQILSIMHGVIRLSNIPRSYGVTRRHLEVVKIRSSAYREGKHDYSLDRRGMVVYPRLIAGEHGENFPNEQLFSNLPAASRPGAASCIGLHPEPEAETRKANR